MDIDLSGQALTWLADSFFLLPTPGLVFRGLPPDNPNRPVSQLATRRTLSGGIASLPRAPSPPVSSRGPPLVLLAAGGSPEKEEDALQPQMPGSEATRPLCSQRA